jgi:hypothetical protein
MKEFMDAGGAASMYENPFEDLSRSSGIAVFAATRGSDVALAKKEDSLTLFTGNFVNALKNGIAYRSDQALLSWLDIRDYIVRATYERLGGDAPIPKIVSLDDKYADITRVPFFKNLAYAGPSTSSSRAKLPRKSRKIISQEESEYHFWSRIPDYADAEVYDDFLRKFPSGTYHLVAFALLKAKLEQKNRDELVQFVTDSPRSRALPFARARLELLHWQQLRDSGDIAPIEAFLAKVTNKQIIEEARRRLDELRPSPDDDVPPDPATPDPPDAPTPGAPAPDAPGWFQTLWLDRGARFGRLVIGLVGLAFAAIALGLFFFSAPKGPAREKQFQDELAALGNDTFKLTNFIERCRLAPECRVGVEAQRRLDGERARQKEAAQFHADLQTAGNDLTKLRPFITSCQASPNCSVLREAQQRLDTEQARQNEASQFRADLQAIGTDVTKLVPFVARCGASANCPVLAEAQQRLEVERARQTEAAQFRADLQAIGSDVAKLVLFVVRCRASANCPVLAEAQQRLDAERARQSEAEQFRRDFQSVSSDIGRLKLFVDRCQKSPNCPVLAEAREKLAQTDRDRQIEEFRNELRSAGTSPGGLAALVDRCQGSPNCPVLAEARERLAQADRERQVAQLRNDLQAAGNDVTRLVAFVEQCQRSANCPVLAEARQKLDQVRAQAERDRQIAQFRSDFQSAGSDAARLAAFVDQCQRSANCPVLAEARQKLDQVRAQAERDRQIAQFRSDFQSAGNDAARLAAFVDQCQKSPNCSLLAEAREKFAQVKAQLERDWQIAQFRADLQAAGTDPIKLAAFIARCQTAANCPVLAEAQQRLQVERARKAPAPAPTFVSYTNNDIDSEAALRTLPKTDLVNCIEACRRTADCVAYTFDKWNKMCFLKSNFTRIRLDPKADSGIRKDQKEPIRASDATLACRYPKSIFTGDLIRSMTKASLEACKSECDRESLCVGYSFLRQERTCSIFSNPTDRSTDDTRGDSGIRAQRPNGSRLCEAQ